MAVQETVTVESISYPNEPEQRYMVKQTVNATKPRIGQILNESQIQALIDGGVKVTVKPRGH